MTDVFIKAFNLSITASWIVLAVVILRLVIKKAPKWISCLLWGIVGLRLVLPFSLESVFSLIPSAEPIPSNITTSKYPTINSGINIVDNTLNPILSSATQGVTQSSNPIESIIEISAYVWIVGIAIMLIYSVISYLSLYMRVRPSILLTDRSYYCDNIDTPFILGIIRPKIYIPSGMSDEHIAYVTRHENAHLKRGDHLIKPLGFLILSIYWFNPVIWLAYILLCRDIESACDEKVIKDMDDSAKREYSETLISCSVRRRVIAACPLAFGEVGVKDRIKSVLSYKKPAFWIILVALIASIAVALCFLTSPLGTGSEIINKIVKQKGYTLVGQEDETITLSIDKSLLPDSIYSEKGHSFDKNEVIAYRDETTTLYLKSVQYANEGEDKLYFCFDFSYDLPKNSGRALYPYEILNNGIADSVTVVSKTLRCENLSYIDAVSVRGQGSGTKVWFYVSTDAIKHAEGIAEFDIKLNLITYIKNGESAMSVLDNVHTDYEGVYLTHKSTDISPDGYSVINVVWHNDTDEDRLFGEFYTIEYKNGNKWESVDTKENRYWQAIAILLGAKSTHEKSYTTQDFDISKPGTYRLRSEFYADEKKCDTWIEFEVVNGMAQRYDAERLAELKRDYPEYFGYTNGKGICVYVWQMAENSYRCGLLPGYNRLHQTSEVWALRGISVEDMKLILNTEYKGMDFTLVPYSMPYSSYHYEINDEYEEKLKAMFGKHTVITGIVNDLSEGVNGEYNGVKIISGNNETIPLSSMLFASIYENGAWLVGDGMGSRAFFDQYGNFTNTIPTLSCDGDIKLELGENYSFIKMNVYDLNHNEIKISGADFDNLNDLSNGLYYVIMGATKQGDFIKSENKYEQTTDEYIFGIIVK